jgi:hypothetical protein
VETFLPDLTAYFSLCHIAVAIVCMSTLDSDLFHEISCCRATISDWGLCVETMTLPNDSNHTLQFELSWKDFLLWITKCLLQHFSQNSSAGWIWFVRETSLSQSEGFPDDFPHLKLFPEDHDDHC